MRERATTAADRAYSTPQLATQSAPMADGADGAVTVVAAMANSSRRKTYLLARTLEHTTRRVALARNRKSCSISETTTCSALTQSFGARERPNRTVQNSFCRSRARERANSSLALHRVRCATRTQYTLAPTDRSSRSCVVTYYLAAASSVRSLRAPIANEDPTKQAHCRQATRSGAPGARESW